MFIRENLKEWGKDPKNNSQSLNAVCKKQRSQKSSKRK